MSILARLGVKLALDSTEFKAGLDDATKNTKQFEANQKKAYKNAQQAYSELGATMGKVSLGIGVALAGVYKIVEKSDEIADLASSFDVSIGSIIGMSKALELAGGKSENLGNMLSKLAVNTQEARDGNDKLRDAFKEVGVTAEEVEKLALDELMERVAQQLASIEDPIKRNAKAVELLGKSAKGIEWDKYVDQYKKLADPDLARAISDMGDAWDNVQRGVSETFYFMVKLVQPLAAVVNYLASIGEQYKALKEEGGTINFDPNNPMADGIEYSGEGKSTPKKEPPKPILTGTKYSKLSDKEKSTADKDKNMLEAAKLISVEYERQQKFALQQLDTKIRLNSMTENERRIQEEVNRVLESTSQKIDDITKRREEAAGRGAPSFVLEEYDRQIEKVNELSEAFVRAARAKEEAAIEEQRTFTYGWNKAFAQYAEDSGNYGKTASDTFASLTSNMNSALDNFVETGKLSFSSLTESIIKDIIKIQLRMQAAQLFSMAFKGMGSFFGGGASGVDNITTAQWTSGAFADGGEPPVGLPSLVGERGPELFVPKTAGTIIPNNQLSSMIGGQPQQVFNGPYIASMNAIDTQSGIQFLAKNKMTIWSMNQSAARSIPAGR